MNKLETYTNNLILVVDDNIDNFYLLQAILEAQGYELLFAENGYEALEVIEIVLPNLILLDVMMPEIDGLELARRIRSRFDFEMVPILLVTAYHELDINQGINSGANGVIRKPIDFDELISSVEAMLSNKFSQELKRDEEKRRQTE